MTDRTANMLRWAFRIALTALFVVMVNRGITRHQVAILGEHVSFLWVAAAMVIGLLSLAFQLLRWREILAIEGFGATFAPAFKTFAWGQLLAFVTPGRIGEFGRALALDPNRKADSVASVVIDKTFAAAATVVFGAVAMLVHMVALGTLPPRLLIVCMAVLLAAVVPAGFCIWLFSRHLTGQGRVASIARRMHVTMIALPRFVTWRVLLYSLAAQGALCIQTALILNMFGSPSLLFNVVLAAEVYAFMLFAPFFVANIGLREYTFGMLFIAMNARFHASLTPEPVALGVSLLILIMNILFPAAVGLVVMIVDKKHKSTI